MKKRENTTFYRVYPPFFHHLLSWSWRLDLNQRPADYKSAALPTELRQHWSGKRGSNPQPTAWKAVALPIELFPLTICQITWSVFAYGYAGQPSPFFYFNILYAARPRHTKPWRSMVARVGFEPTKAEPTDLQSVPFNHSGISPLSYRFNDVTPG